MGVSGKDLSCFYDGTSWSNLLSFSSSAHCRAWNYRSAPATSLVHGLQARRAELREPQGNGVRVSGLNNSEVHCLVCLGRHKKTPQTGGLKQ